MNDQLPRIFGKENDFFEEAILKIYLPAPLNHCVSSLIYKVPANLSSGPAPAGPSPQPCPELPSVCYFLVLSLWDRVPLLALACLKEKCLGVLGSGLGNGGKWSHQLWVPREENLGTIGLLATLKPKWN